MLLLLFWYIFSQHTSGARVFNWWLYSYEHVSAQPGTYYLQTWLTPPEDATNIAQGKYEMTLGPWKWYRYASSETLAQAHDQGTTCSCAYNELDYREKHLERLGGVSSTLMEQQLPGGSCAATTGSTNAESSSASASASSSTGSMCQTIDQQAYRSEGSAIEWSGMFALTANTTYQWSYFAYYNGKTEHSYPDPGMFIYVVEATSIESVAANADAALKAAVDEDPKLIRTEGMTVSIQEDAVQYIQFTNTSLANSTTVLLQPTKDVSIAVFTQHVPSEFMAHVLKDATTGKYIFPTNMTLYSDDVKNDNNNNDGNDGNNNTSPPTSDATGGIKSGRASLILLFGLFYTMVGFF